jgi:hypothetical protein
VITCGYGNAVSIIDIAQIEEILLLSTWMREIVGAWQWKSAEAMNTFWSSGILYRHWKNL